MRAASLIVFAALALAGTASGANSIRIGAVDTSDYPTVRYSVVTQTPSSSAPSVRENGIPVVGLAAENLGRAKSVVLGLDRSQSMRGQPIVDATEAARAFAAAKPAADRIAIVAASSKAVRLTDFSTATIDADGALRSIDTDDTYGTALWDSVVLSSEMLAAETLQARILILLTDGQEISSEATLERAISVARNSGVSVYVIGIESEKFQPAPLQRLAAETGGNYYSAVDSSALTAVYASIAEELRRTWRISYLTASPPGESVELATGVRGMGAATTTAAMPGAAVATVEPSSGSKLMPGFLYENNIGTMLLALFAGTCIIIAFILILATSSGTRLRRRLDPHTAVTTKRRDKTSPRERFSAASGLMTTTEKSLAHLRFWKFLHRRIEQADLPLRTVELFYMCIGAGILFGLIGAVAAVPPLATLGLMAFGAALPVLYATFKARRRVSAIEEQLPDLLITIAASLKAGHSFRQGLQAVVDEGQPPASDEFKRVLTETSLGRPMDDALNEMSERVGSKNLEFVITAVTIQRQVGGSLAGIFDMVADSVRQRQQFARKVKGLTAMGRMAAYVLIGLPFFLAFMFTLINPDYMRPLWETSAGHKIVISGLVAMALGSAVLRKMTAFKG
jgi:tight adherence protein B